MENNISEISEISDQDLKKLTCAWKCILEQYRLMAKENSIKETKGMNIFKMTLGNKEHNCEYYFAGEDCWDIFLDNSPQKNEFLKKYDYKKMYCIVVSIPMMTNKDIFIQKIRLFNFDTDDEIII